MAIFWGTLITLTGLFILVGTTLRTDFIIYQLLIARSQLLWSDHGHLFHQLVGALLIGLGLLWACRIIWDQR